MEPKDVKGWSSDTDSGEDWIQCYNWDQSLETNSDWDQSSETDSDTDQSSETEEVDLGEPVLDVFYKVFGEIAQDLLLDKSLIGLARQLLNLFKKHPLDRDILDKTASDISRNKTVDNALMKHAEGDSLSFDLGDCFCYAKNQNDGKQKTEYIDCLRAHPLFENLVLNDQDNGEDMKNMLCLALSFVFGYWLFCDESKMYIVAEKIMQKKTEEGDKKKALENPKGNTTPHTEQAAEGSFVPEGRQDYGPSMSPESFVQTPKGNTTPHRDGAREMALRIVSFFLEEQGSFGSSMSPESLERLTHKITQEVNMVKQLGPEQTTEDFGRPKKRVRPVTHS